MIPKTKSFIIQNRFFVFTQNIFTHPLFSGSAIMVIGSNMANGFAYLYHLVLGKMLGPASYGELVSVISILTMITSAFNFIGLVVVKFVSASDEKKLDGLFSWFAKRGIAISIFFALSIALLSPGLARFLHVDLSLVILLSPIIFFIILSLVLRSFLQGMLQFFKIAFLGNLEMAGRLIVGAILVYLGYSVFGALMGNLVATFFVFILTRKFLSKYTIFGKEVKNINTREIVFYSFPIFLTSIATNSFFSTDVILVKHFFSSETAGVYGAVATLGKIVFFGAAPISGVMFPLISKKHSQGDSYIKVFFLSLLCVLALSLTILCMFLLFPDLVVSTLYGKTYLGASQYLVTYGIFIVIFTLSTLIVNFHLSVKDTKPAYMMMGAALLQAVCIVLYHNDVMQVIYVSLWTAVVLFISLLLYFAYGYKKTYKF